MKDKETQKTESTEKTEPVKDTLSENTAKPTDKEDPNKDQADTAPDPDQNEHAESAESADTSDAPTGSCCGSSGCTCGKNQESQMKDDQPSQEEDRKSFFEELNALVEKFGGHVVSSGAMIGGPIPFPHLPRCANADTCEDADECPFAKEDGEGESCDEAQPRPEKHAANPSDTEIIISALNSIGKRLSRIESLLQPSQLEGECITAISEIKSPKIRKKDIKKIAKKVNKKVSETIEDELEDFIYDVRAAFRTELQEHATDLKSYIDKLYAESKATTGSKTFGYFQMPRAEIEMPKSDWTMNDWIRFHHQLSQFILSSKAYPAGGKGNKK